MNIKGKIIGLTLASTLSIAAFTSSAPVESGMNIITFGEIPAGATVLGTYERVSTVGLSHYGGSYWKNVAGTIKLEDKYITDASIIAEAMQKEPVPMEVLIPEAITNAQKAGKKVGVLLEVNEGYTMKDLFYTGSAKEKHYTFNINTTTNKMEFKAYPKINFLQEQNKNYTFKDIAHFEDIDLPSRSKIPIVDPKYGVNVFYMETIGNVFPNPKFPKSTGTSSTAMYINPSKLNDATGSELSKGVHPNYITTTTGNINAPHKIKTSFGNDSYEYATNKIKIQSGFANAGSMGLFFYYPIKVTFFIMSGENAEITAEKVKITKLSTNKEITSVSPEDNVKFSFQYKFTSAVGTKVPQDIELSVVGYSSPDMTKEVVNKPIILSTDSELELDKLKNQDITLIIPKASAPTMIGVSKIYWKVYINGGSSRRYCIRLQNYDSFH